MVLIGAAASDMSLVRQTLTPYDPLLVHFYGDKA
jgi:hypothetical protein